MTAMNLRLDVATWVALVALQGTAAGFFVVDVSSELARDGVVLHTSLESFATLALVCGVVMGSREIRRLTRQARDADVSLRRATEEFSAMVERRFAEWSLTSAEREVAMLVLKGFDIAEIAEFRHTAEGTVRAQLSHIYEKSGLPSRGRFVSAFLDILIETPVGGGAARPRAAAE